MGRTGRNVFSALTAIRVPGILGMAVLFCACSVPLEGPLDVGNDGGGTTQKTALVFNNTRGICTVAVYDDPLRRETDKLAEIPAGYSSEEISWSPASSVPFYFSYLITINDNTDVTVVYIPGTGKDQTAVRIDPGKITDVAIPKLDETLSSPAELLSDYSFVVIQNLSSFSFQLLQGASSIKPDGSANSALVNNGETAVYTLAPGAVSGYAVHSGGASYAFPTVNGGSFAAGHIYSFSFSGSSVSLSSDKTINLESVKVPQVLNGDLSFTTWKDSGKTNGIMFGSRTVKLSGDYWAAYGNESLESEYRAESSVLVIWTNREESRGFSLSVIKEGSASVIRSVSSQGAARTFYKE